MNTTGKWLHGTWLVTGQSSVVCLCWLACSCMAAGAGVFVWWLP
jgi:hypothetical protein